MSIRVSSFSELHIWLLLEALEAKWNYQLLQFRGVQPFLQRGQYLTYPSKFIFIQSVGEELFSFCFANQQLQSDITILSNRSP